jgi:hypothetical protein
VGDLSLGLTNPLGKARDHGHLVFHVKKLELDGGAPTIDDQDFHVHFLFIYLSTSEIEESSSQ